ncbi:hypothetical protein [Providencia rettgeri]|uniref:hypothetical protein n=1 Tax=Providencia rettgeri TaxID=587 RepID=UPI0034E075C8
MTNIQLLLLATNNLINNTELSHSQESYVYQYYYTHVANQFTSITDFMADFIHKTAGALNNDSLASISHDQIYLTVEQYLVVAEKRYIERQKLLQQHRGKRSD